MPPRHLVPRYTCSSRNAFNPSAALIATFLRVPIRPFSRPSTWERPDRQEHGLPEARQLSEDSIQIRQVPIVETAFRKHALRPEAAREDNVSREADQSTEGSPSAKRQEAFRKSWQNRIQPPSFSEKKARAIARHETAKRLAATWPDVAQRVNARNDNLDALEAQKQRSADPKHPGVAAEHWSSRFVFDPANARFRGDTWKKQQQNLGRRAHEISQQKVSPHDTREIKMRQRHLDYKGMYIDTPDSPMSAPRPVPWLLNVDHAGGKNAMDLLDSEIESFARWMDCTPMETAARASLAEQVIELINGNVDSRVQVEQFGSDEVGLATILSDIDIRLSFQDERTSNSHGMTGRMKAIESALSNHPDFILVSFRNARYPIINTQHKSTGIDVQIVGAPDTHAQREAMAHYLNTIPQLRSVYMVLKTALGIRGLVDVFNGGIGSYGLFMMLAASLQRPRANPPRTAADSLLRFLDFYSDLNMEKYGVSVSPPKLFKKHDVFTTATKSHIDAARRRGGNIRAAQWAIGQARIYQPYLFCLQDPAAPLNDLGRKSNAIKHLQTTIRVLSNTLTKYLADGFPYVSDPLPWLDGSLLLPLVGRCHEIYHDRRSRAELQGRIAVETRPQNAIQTEEQGVRSPVKEEAVKDEAGRSGWPDLEREKAAA